MTAEVLVDDQVTLEAYVDENRALIHNRRNDQAIAICKHILHYYPKHIDSYRQMGEAYLEKEELDPATEMFRRVLSADPENVIAYVGLATIFEQQHLIDEAVWHLERAYEIAPGNFEISKELLRMYGEAGAPRQRVKLTSAGLARLYAQEGLYSQAIQELRAISSATPARFDARVALAETLWQMGRIREAAEVAQSILTSLPYCLKANLILGAAWKESGLPDSETYLSRAQELDPTNKVSQLVFGTRSPLEVAQIAVPRYIEGVPPPPMPGSTPSTLIQLEPSEPSAEEAEIAAANFFAEPPIGEAEPTAETVQASLPVQAEPEVMTKPDLPTVKLPPWLLSEFTESAQVEPQTPSETKPAEEPEPKTSTLSEETAPRIQEPGLPAWLTGQSPIESAQAAPAETVEPEEEKLPSWLEGAGETTPSTSMAEQKVEPAEAAQVEDVPDWLRQLQAPTAPAEETPPAPLEQAAPDWLRGLQAPTAPAEETPPAPLEQAAPSEEYVMPGFLTQPPAEPKPVEGPAALDFLAAEAGQAQPAEERVVDKTPPTAELAAEAPTETFAEMPPAPAVVQTSPPIVVEMPPAETAPQPTEVPAPEPTAPTPKRKRQPKGYPHLVLAREHRDANHIDDALVEYDWLVQHAPRVVSSVIEDLEVLTARRDAPLEAHRILGDAYSRADRLAEALQRYHYVLERTPESSQSSVSDL